jgi:hypothetical protein
MWPEMLTVTERAKAKLKKLLDSESDDRSIGLRLGKTASGALGVFPDRERPDDRSSNTKERPCCSWEGGRGEAGRYDDRLRGRRARSGTRNQAELNDVETGAGKNPVPVSYSR